MTFVGRSVRIVVRCRGGSYIIHRKVSFEVSCVAVDRAARQRTRLGVDADGRGEGALHGDHNEPIGTG